ncbi:MAG: hypothetical protein LUC50_08790 [Ruminococcus sp.]|nr:hypothetical protein [Ruminococcus sp.]
MKTLTIYYSRAGHTAAVAKKIQAIVGGDLFEIKGTKNYGSYVRAIMIARREFSSGEMLKFMGDVEDFDSYDRILVGFPVWYGKAPQLVISFLVSHNFKGKEVYPFCTSGSSGPEGAQQQLQNACGKATVHSGIRFKEVNKVDVEAWLEG